MSHNDRSHWIGTAVPLLALAWVLIGAAGNAAPAQPATTAMPDSWNAENLQPVGYVALPDSRPFKLGLKRVGDKFYLFTGEGGSSSREKYTGFGVIDVTDPKNPQVLTHVAVPEGDGQITLHGDLLIAGAQLPFPPPSAGGSLEYPYKGATASPNALATLFDISNPARPRKLGDWIANGWGTHRNSYPGGNYAYMSAWIEGFRGQSVLVIIDVSDPAKPQEVARWWMPGQREDETETTPPAGYHGPPVVSSDGKMLTVGFTPALVNLDITDPTKPKVIGKLVFSPLAAVGTQAIHSVVPIGGTLLHVSTEPSAAGCGKESSAFAAIVDNADPKHPRLVAYYPRPTPAPATRLKSFCGKEGRFGPHNINTELHQDAVKQTAPLVFQTYFNAGLRVYSIADPFAPREVGWFMPKIGAWAQGRRGPEDVIVDTRGYIYVSTGLDRGIWILRYTGKENGVISAK